MTVTEEIFEDKNRYTNFYRHRKCGAKWEDNWSCECNDRCPKCNAEIQPYESRDNYDGVLLLLDDGTKCSLAEFIDTNTVDPDTLHISNEEAAAVVALAQNEVATLGIFGGGITHVRRIDGLEICGECTGSGWMVGPCPCKICMGTGYTKKN